MANMLFERCKTCENPVRIVNIHGKTVEYRCYYQLDTMKECWDKDDCNHFYEPRNAKTSVLGDALREINNKKFEI